MLRYHTPTYKAVVSRCFPRRETIVCECYRECVSVGVYFPFVFLLLVFRFPDRFPELVAFRRFLGLAYFHAVERLMPNVLPISR